MVLEEFHSMLLCAELFIYTDHKNLTFANLNCCGILRWQSFVEEYGPTIFITLARKMSLPTLSHSSHVVRCCQFLCGRMLLLFSLTSLLKALTSAITLTCLSAFSTYHCPNSQKPILLTLRGYIHNRTVWSWPQKQLSTQTNTSISLLMVVSLSVMPFQMRIAWHNGK